MTVTATDAKNRFGQVLEQAQKRPVFIEKAGRRHSVVMSVELYDKLRRKERVRAEPAPEVSAEGRAFYAKHKDWVDMQNEHFEKHGLFGEEYRAW